MIRTLIEDAVELTRASSSGDVSTAAVLRTVVLADSYAILATTRVRSLARRLRVPGVNRLLRLAQTAVFGVEIGKEVTLGRGVYFVHPLGTVIGGTAKIGDRVRFFGNNTVGTAKDDGYPVLDEDVVVGCGARILGPVHIGARAIIGANAVVLCDVPADATAMGVPAVVHRKSDAVIHAWGLGGPPS